MSRRICVELPSSSRRRVEAVGVDAAGQLEVAHLEAVVVRVVVRGERVVRRAEVRRLAQADLPRQVDVGRQARLVRPAHLRDDAAGRRDRCCR